MRVERVTPSYGKREGDIITSSILSSTFIDACKSLRKCPFPQMSPRNGFDFDLYDFYQHPMTKGSIFSNITSDNTS